VRDALLQAVEASGVKCMWNTEAVEISVENGVVRGVHVASVANTPVKSQDTAARVLQVADPCAEFESRCGNGVEVGSARRFLEAECVVVNADLASAEVALLPPSLRRSEYAERSEVSRLDAAATAGRSVASAANRLRDVAAGIAVAMKTVAGTAAPGVAEPAERLRPRAAGKHEGSTSEGLLRAGGWRYSSSTVSFYFCLGRRYEQLRHHNVFLAPSSAWDGLFDADSYARWDAKVKAAPIHFYVHAPARSDPTVVDAPEDDAIMVLVPVPPIDERLSPEELHAATEQLVLATREAVVRTFEGAGMAGFRDAIVDERVRTPLGWRDSYGLRRGAVFGLSHNLEQLAFARPGRRHPGVDGLHWVGANTRPGNGVPLVLIGAMKTVTEALADLGITGR
jgi:phytoene dehydrogenase-like protein